MWKYEKFETRGSLWNIFFTADSTITVASFFRDFIIPGILLVPTWISIQPNFKFTHLTLRPFEMIPWYDFWIILPTATQDFCLEDCWTNWFVLEAGWINLTALADVWFCWLYNIRWWISAAVPPPAGTDRRCCWWGWGCRPGSGWCGCCSKCVWWCFHTAACPRWGQIAHRYTAEPPARPERSRTAGELPSWWRDTSEAHKLQWTCRGRSGRPQKTLSLFKGILFYEI